MRSFFSSQIIYKPGFVTCRFRVQRLKRGRWLIIYLACALPHRSSGSYDEHSAGTLGFEPLNIHLLAADRVYRLPASPLVDTSFYLAHFILTGPFAKRVLRVKT